MPGINYNIDLKTGGFTSGINSAISGVGALGGKLLGLAGIAVSVAGAVAGVKRAISTAANLETTTRQFETLLGSVAEANRMISDIRKYAADTSFELPDTTNAARLLLSYGTRAKEVINVMKRLGDISAISGANLGELATLYGRSQEKGVLYAEELNQWMERGTKISEELARVMGVPVDQVRKLAEEGKVTFAVLQQAIGRLTNKGGSFFDGAARQGQTMIGQWSKLKDGINEVFVTLGQPLNDALRPMLEDAIKLTAKINEAAKSLVYTLRAAMQEGQLGDLLKSQLIRGLKEGGNFLNALMRGLGAGLMEWGSALWDSLRQLPEFLFAAGMNLLGGAQVLLKGDFWNGVATQFTSIGLRFAAAIGDSLLPVIDTITDLVNKVRAAFGKAPIGAAGLKTALQITEALAGAADASANSSFVKAVGSVRPQTGPKLQGMEMMVGRVANAFAEAFNTAPNAFNTRGEEEAWATWKSLGGLQRSKDEKAAKAAESQERAAERQTLAADNIAKAAKLMERLFGAPEEGRGRIKTFNRAESATRRFMRRSKADRDGSLMDFLGPIDADLGPKVGANLGLSRIHRANARASAKTGGNEEKLLSRIEDNTRKMGENISRLMPA